MKKAALGDTAQDQHCFNLSVTKTYIPNTQLVIFPSIPPAKWSHECVTSIVLLVNISDQQYFKEEKASGTASDRGTYECFICNYFSSFH